MLNDRDRQPAETLDSGAVFVELVAVSHSFGARAPLFAPVSRLLLPSRTYALTGPSGSGKSTLLGILAGSLAPSLGTVRTCGVARTGRVLQNPHGTARRSALDHVVLPFLARGERRRSAQVHAEALLSTFGLEERAATPFARLSGGEAQRLMLARAVASAPDLLLVDEPTAQLDSRSAETVIEVLGHVSSGGSIVVVATHDPRAAAACETAIELAP